MRPCKACDGTGVEPDPATYRAKRKERGWTLSQVAEWTGFSLPYVSDLERGNRSLSGRALDAFNKLYGADREARNEQ